MTVARPPAILDHLSALADTTRSRILLLLDRHELTVSELCSVMQLPQSTVSRHLKALSDSGWIAARGEGTSNDYFPPEVPALPAFALQKAISTTIRDHTRDYWTGTVYTTNRRVWEHDEEFKKYLQKIRAMCIDMETATIFMTGFYNEIPTGALLLVSDQPMTPDGVKTADSDRTVDQKFVKDHLRIGIDSLKQLINHGLTVKHLKF